jgi:chromosome segregation protein
MVRAIGELSGHEQELVAEEETLALEAKQLSEQLADAVKNLARLEREEAGLALERSHAHEAATALLEETQQLTAERDALKKEKAAFEAGREETRAASSKATETLVELETNLARAETEREEVLGRVHEMRVSWARLEGELRDARSTEKRLGDELDDLTSEWDRTIREQEEGCRQIGEIEHDLEELANTVQEYHVLREERATVVSDREREKTEATAREQQDSESLRDTRRRATRARQESHEAELKLNEIKGNLHHLEERLREEYEIDAEELDQVDMGELPEDAPAVLLDMKERIRRLGPVNLLAVEEYEEKSQRLEFMTTQRDDLVQAKSSLIETIQEINKTASGMFMDTFAAVRENFEKTFKVLFQGGECSLNLTGDDPLEADIEVMARPRGKKPQSIQQLSSGERALTAIALLFAIYLVKPSPFCILDEVDAPLDDANIDRFVRMVKEFSTRTQFIVITHNKKTMEVADCLYGITMQRPGVSSVVSVKLDGERTNGDGARGEHGSKEDDPLSPESLIAQ